MTKSPLISTTFLVHKTVRGAKLVSEFGTRLDAVAELSRKLERYRSMHGPVANSEINERLPELYRCLATNADVDIELGGGAGATITTRALVPGQDLLVRRCLWDRQPRADPNRMPNDTFPH
jgi:hypothetical protein